MNLGFKISLSLGVVHALIGDVMILLPILILPLAWLSAWVLNLSGHYAYRTSEQVRLDAYTLSLCHHRKNFIETKLMATNDKIQKIQSLMDELAIPCMAASEGAGIFGEAVCEGVFLQLKSLSHSGQVLEIRQDTYRMRYPAIQENLRDYLRRENELDESRGRLIEPTRISGLAYDGFSREDLGNQERILEDFFGIRWPRQVVTNASFHEIHLFKAKFEPKRILIGAGGSKDLNGLNTRRTGFSNTQASVSNSKCEVASDGGLRFQVKRK